MAESQLDLKDDTADPIQPIVTSYLKPESAFVTFATSFVTVFLAEIGDKTQLSTLLMSAGSHKPWTIFFGSAAALITTSLLGVLLGGWIASKFSPKALDAVLGCDFLRGVGI
jgi:putative Ca2+/H+ antiporter (TMEM165/GDT1 family)